MLHDELKGAAPKPFRACSGCVVMLLEVAVASVAFLAALGATVLPLAV